MFAQSAGLDMGLVEQSAVPQTYWHNICVHAHRTGRLEELVQQVSNNYPDALLQQLVSEILNDSNDPLNSHSGEGVDSALIVGDLPLESRSFFGRRDALDWLQEAIETSSSDRVTVVTGMNGIGKTQLARSYALQCQSRHRQVLWISGEDEGLLVASSAGVAQQLGLQGFLPDRPESSMPAIRRYLERTPGCLLVIDSADPSQIANLIPRQGASRVLISSNSTAWSSLTNQVLALQPLDTSESTAMLLERTGSDDYDAALRIASAVENHPLALEQAAAYVSSGALSLNQYANLIEQSMAKLLESPDELFSYPRSVVAAVTISIDQTGAGNSYAVSLLFFLSQFGRSHVPRELASDGMSLLVDSDGLPCDDLCFAGAVSDLAGASLVRLESESFSIHSIVQSVAMTLIPPDHRDDWSRHAVARLAETMPWPIESREHWDIWRRRIDLALEVLTTINWELVDPSDDVLGFANTAIVHLAALGRFADAYQIANALVEYARRSDPLDAFAVAGALINLAVSVKHEDSLAQATGPLLEAIHLLENVPEPDLETQSLLAIAYSNLAGCYFDDDDESTWQQSYDLWKKALDLHSAALGQTSISASIDLNNLAKVHRARGDWEAAYRDWKKVVRQHRRNLSHSDYRLSVSLYNLATAAFNLGKPQEAEDLLREAEALDDDLYDDIVVWDRLATVEGLAQLYGTIGNLTESLRFYDKAIPMADALYGEATIHAQGLREQRSDIVQRIDTVLAISAAVAITDEYGVPLWRGRKRTMQIPIEYFDRFKRPSSAV